MNNFDTDGRKKFHRRKGAIGLCVVYFLDVAEIDETLCTSRTWQVGYKRVFLDRTGTVAVDDRVLFAMQTTAIAGFVSITAVGQARGVAVVADSQDLSEICTCDDSPYV